MATGIYTYDAVPKPFHFVGPGTILGGDDERMIQLFVDDIEQGIQGTGDQGRRSSSARPTSRG